MNLQRWHRIGEIYHSALPLLQSERSTFVATICGNDTILQQEVNSLLEADESSGDFLETSVFQLGLKILMDDKSKSFETRPDVDRPPTDKLVGTTLDGRYLVERALGHGGVGAVYLARDHKLHDKPVVVKVLLEKSLHNEWVVLKFQQEKEALARVDHPGVVGILDTGELPDGEPYIVMQYVDGMSLRIAINAKPEGMDLDRAASIVKQAGAALSAVHEKKIYHRDLKPENIMLQKLGRNEEQVKIVDFGIAKVKESLVAPSTVTGVATAGTIRYMSPEHLRGDRVTAASDIYSLGVIAYEMVTGRRPFNPDTVAHLSDMQREGVRAKPTDLRPRLPEEAERLILNALAFDPQARQQNAGEFGDALSRALMNEEETLKQHRKEVVELPPTQVSVEPISPETQPAEQSAKTLVTPFEPARTHTHEQPIALPVEPEIQKRRWPKLAIVLVLGVALAFGAYWIISKRQSLFSSGAKTTPVTPVTQRSLAYSLTVQKMRDGKPYKEPFESSGQEIFENGYKFRLNVSSPQAGYLYVFNEGAPEKDNTDFTIIYPTPLTNKGSAKLDANQTVQTNWNAFAGETGTERFWIVWSATAVTQLDSARDEAFKNKEGAITDAAMVRNVKDFFAKHSDPKPETKKDTVKQQTDVRASGDILVKLLELEHR
jgi:serine/threonine protein kinase